LGSSSQKSLAWTLAVHIVGLVSTLTISAFSKFIVFYYKKKFRKILTNAKIIYQKLSTLALVPNLDLPDDMLCTRLYEDFVDKKPKTKEPYA